MAPHKYGKFLCHYVQSVAGSGFRGTGILACASTFHIFPCHIPSLYLKDDNSIRPTRRTNALSHGGNGALRPTNTGNISVTASHPWPILTS